MSLPLTTLFLATVLAAQHPGASPPLTPALSAEEVAHLEAVHLKNIRQVTSGLAKAGEGSLPDGRSIIFKRFPIWLRRFFTTPSPMKMDTRFILELSTTDAPRKAG